MVTVVIEQRYFSPYIIHSWECVLLLKGNSCNAATGVRSTENQIHCVLGIIVNRKVHTLMGNQPLTTLCTSWWGRPWIQCILCVHLVLRPPAGHERLWREVCVWAPTDAILRAHVCPGIYSLTKQVTERCLTCRKVNKQTLGGNLPGERNPGLRPFQSIKPHMGIPYPMAPSSSGWVKRMNQTSKNTIKLAHETRMP
jgi:hypothetical protein